MASKDDLISKIVAVIASFDDASWEALANKGLLRRARKDLEKGLTIEIEETTHDSLIIKVPPFAVTMSAAGPASATCTCPSPGVCQHILAAGLYLQTLNSPSSKAKTGPTADSIRQEIALITPETLKSWAGAVDYRAGLTLLEKNSLPTIVEYGETVVIRLMPSTIEVRFVPGAGLAGMILPKRQGKRAGVAALLALRRTLGQEIPSAVAQPALVDLSGTPRTKKEILESSCAVLEEAVAIGLSHVSPAVGNRLVTLAVSAQAAGLPRVSLALKTVSDEIDSILQRLARADEARLLFLISRVYALMESIRSGGEDPGSALAGINRAQYVDVPEIELSGIGAYTWLTGSGYKGLTVLFWCNQTNEFLSWSDARPDELQFDPRQRFFTEGPWQGAQSPQQVACSSLQLRNGRRTANGRISGSTKTSALVLSPTSTEKLEFGEKLFTTWEALRRYLRSTAPLGLREPNPLDLIAVIEPQAFGARAFDPINQTFSWEVYDEIGQFITLTLPFSHWSKEAILVLEQLSPPSDKRWRFVVKLAAQNEAVVEPISILRDESESTPVFQLSFDTLSQPASTSNSHVIVSDLELVESAAESEAESDVESDEPLRPANFRLYRVIDEINKRLEALAETGLQRDLAPQQQWFAQSRTETNQLGLTALAVTLGSLSGPSQIQSRHVIRARFLTSLHNQACGHLI